MHTNSGNWVGSRKVAGWTSGDLFFRYSFFLSFTFDESSVSFVFFALFVFSLFPFLMDVE